MFCERLKLAALGVCAPFIFSGCIMVGPDYEVPENAVPDNWGQAVSDELQQENPILKQWWTVFDDPMLDELIAEAEAGNIDLKVAVARIQEARAQRGYAAGDWYPQIGANGEVSAVRSSEETTGTGNEEILYGVGLSVGWELDFWGRIGRSVESADASLAASVEDYRDTLIVLYSDLATSYMQVRTLQDQILLASANLAAQTETMTLVTNRFDAGLVPELDVQQSKLNLAQTGSAIPTFRASLAQSIYRLSILCGKEPNALLKQLSSAAPLPPMPETVAVGLPADLLRKRPDIRAAERRLAAATARIGMTKAELYPTFTLPGTFSLQSYDAGSIGDGLAYSFGPQFKWNLFTGKKIRSAVEVEESLTLQANLAYEQTVLNALEEVESAMVGLKEETERQQRLQEAVTAAQSSVELVTTLYKSGLTNFQNVLDMQRSLTAQQDNLAVSKGIRVAYLIKLYKALGGGWTPPATGTQPPETPAATVPAA